MPGKNYLQMEYDDHAAFRMEGIRRFDFALVREETERFNSLYRFVAGNGTRIPQAKRADLSAELDSVLAAVFAKLSRGAEGAQALFFKDLGKFAHKLLADDLRFHFRPRGFGDRSGAAYEWKLALSRDRYFTSRIKPDAVQEILAIARPELEQFQRNLAAGKFKREDLSVNGGDAVKGVTKVLNRAYGELGILDAVSFYQGQETIVGGCAIELSSEKTRWWTNLYEEYPKDAASAYFHFDEALDVPKSILYLTDTDAGTGATGVVPQARLADAIAPIQTLFGRVLNYIGTAEDSEPALRELYKQKYHVSLGSKPKRLHFMGLPAEFRFNSHFGFDVIPGSELEKNLVEAETLVTGPAGTCLVFDGAQLLHRGGLVRNGHRIALQIIFSKKETFAHKLRRKSKQWISKPN